MDKKEIVDRTADFIPYERSRRGIPAEDLRPYFILRAGHVFDENPPNITENNTLAMVVEPQFLHKTIHVVGTKWLQFNQFAPDGYEVEYLGPPGGTYASSFIGTAYEAAECLGEMLKLDI